jgi:hypothetical protein
MQRSSTLKAAGGVSGDWTKVRCERRDISSSIKDVIYCVVPEALADELLDKLANYYADDPGVEVIVDRRKTSRRGRSSSGGGNRAVRDRRRPRVTGELPELATD